MLAQLLQRGVAFGVGDAHAAIRHGRALCLIHHGSSISIGVFISIGVAFHRMACPAGWAAESRRRPGAACRRPGSPAGARLAGRRQRAAENR